jgi:translocation and assembly module TamB
MSTARPLFSPDPPPERRPTPFPEQPAPRRRWPRVLAWIGGVLVALLLIVCVTVAVLLNSARFHDYVIAKVQTVATDKLNARVQLQNYSLHFAPLSLDVYGVVIHGADPYFDPPVLQLQHAELGVGITSFLHKQWYIQSVRVDHPIVQVLIDKDGNSNLPKPKPSNSSNGNTSIFDLGVRHAVLDQGEIYFNGQKNNLFADLLDLNFNAGFRPEGKVYSGTLAYSKGQVLFGSYKPIEHSLLAQFDLSPTTFQLHRVDIHTNAASVHVVATATNFDSPIVDAQYQLDVDGASVAKIINSPSLPSGNIQAAGKAHYQQIPNQPAINSLQLNGDLTSRALLVHTPSLRTSINNLAAHYSLASGDAVLHDFRAAVLGGEITAQGTIKQVGGDHPQNNFTANIHNVSLAQASSLAGTGKQPVNISGVLNANAKASWGKTMNDLLANVDASIRGEAAPRPQPGMTNASLQSAAAQNVPIDSEIHATYAGARQEITLRQSYVHLPQTDITLNGTLSQHSSLAVRMQANDLSQLAAIANAFSTPKPGTDPNHPQQQPFALSGRATFQGNVTGSTSAPHLTGQLNASNLNVNGTAWKVFRTNVDASPSQASLRGADLEPAAGGRITLDATTGLKKWAFTNTSPLQVNLNASQLNVADLAHMAGQNVPISGTLNTQLTLHGTELNPIGNGTLSLTKVVAYNEPISSIQARFNGTGDDAHATLSIQMPAGNVQGNVDVRPRAKTYNAQVTSTGIDLGKIQTLKSKNMDATGVVAIRANGQGSFDNPQLNASVQIPTLVLQKQTVKDVNLNVDMANHVANATLTSAAINSSIQAKARVNLTGDYQTEASFDTQGIPLQPLVAIYSPAQASAISGSTELHATVRGPIKNTRALEAHVTIPYLRVGYNQIQLATAAPLHADYVNGVLNLQHGSIRGTDTDVNFEGSIPLLDRAAAMSLRVNGNVNLQLAQMFDPDVRTSGQLRFNINSHGTTGKDIGGEIDIVDANYASADLPVGLQHGNGVLTLTTDRINIKSFQGTVGGGTVTASGGVAYRPAIQFDLGMAAKGIKLLYPQGMREAIDANIHLAGTTENAILGGTVNLADISFTPAFELTDFASQFSSGVAAPPSAGGIAQNINLNLNLHSTNNVSLVSRTLSVNGSANLQVRGTAANPVILGRVNLTGGDIVINNERFVLSGGTIQFVNPSQTEPVINLGVTSTIQQYDIAMRISGPSDHMNIQYSSDPSLPQADILNLIAFGTTTGAAAGNVKSSDQSATPPTQMAEQVVASQVASQVTSRFAKVAGISQLSISPVLGNQSNGNNAGANITIQQRVTGNLFVTFSTNTASTQNEVIQGQYKISPRVSVSATRDQNGGFAVDGLIKKEW